MKPERNDPCICGSGKRYEHCCEGKAAPRSAAPSPDQFKQLIALYNARRYAELEIHTGGLIGRYPDSGFAWKLLGASLQMQGKSALSAFQKAAQLMPDDAEAHNSLALELQKIGQAEIAVTSYMRSLEINPNSVSAHYNLGNVLKDLGQLEDAAASYRQAIKIKPDFAEAFINLGVVLRKLGQTENAISSFRRSIQIKPDLVMAYNNLGNALRDNHQDQDAVASYRRAMEIKPDYAEAHYNLGSTLQELRQFESAAASHRRAIEINPDFADAHNNLGNTLQELRQIESAVASYRRAIEIKPDFADAHNNLGNALMKIKQYDNALASYRRAIEIKPDFADAHNNIGCILNLIGQLDEAVASFRKALEYDPDFTKAQSNLLMTLNYSVHTPEQCLEEAQKYGQMVARKVTARFSTWLCEDKPRRLRVGMVSGQFRYGPTGFFLESFLSHFDPSRVELIAYPINLLADDLTSRIKQCFIEWKPLIGKSDEAAAQLIHADGVHILLDLAGHSGQNRLPMFAWKPAPVQANWLDYFATTGVSEIDYLLADPVGVPEANRKYFTETVWHLPDSRLCFTPPDVDLPVAPLPAQKGGHITFGCFQTLPKITNNVLATWGRISAAMPNAKFRLQCKQLEDQAVVKQLILRLQQHGIDPARVKLTGSVTRKNYLAAHAEVDMILDTFPYPGGTTTCEALWMGVPTLTLAGDTLLSRQGASLLTAAGLSEWIAQSEEVYIDRALAFASDFTRLASIRAGLREQVRSSPLFDAPRFARNLEDALWGMWQARNGQE
jgi:predicted O-linked N-acetylglucosamine transferase (SPINDLY family)